MKRFHLTSKKLQSVDIDLGTVIILYKSLIQYVSNLRDMFDLYETKAKEKSMLENYQDVTMRKKKRKLMVSETGRGETQLDGEHNFKANTYLVILDCLNIELNKQIVAYEQKFLFFFNNNKLSGSEIYEKAQKLQKHYKEDIASTFPNECVHFKKFLMALLSGEFPDTITRMYSTIIKNECQDLYPYVKIALRIFLSCAI